jgi:hypothetical protein
VRSLEPEKERPKHEDFRPFDYHKWNDAVVAWDRKHAFNERIKAIAEGKT